MLRALTVFSASLALLCVVAWAGHVEGSGDTEAAKTGLLALEARRLNGAPESLERYRGDVLLVVNTASRCGYTPQYEGLQALYDRYHDQGFSVLGFPSNDFAGQEPGNDQQIVDFCRMNYGVEFPMFSKVKVKGTDAHPVYHYLTSLPEPIGGPVGWNFQKYLVDRNGVVVARYEPKTSPEDPSIVAEIEALLAVPAKANGASVLTD
jgi:glutathione peroxidase